VRRLGQEYSASFQILALTAGGNVLCREGNCPAGECPGEICPRGECPLRESRTMTWKARAWLIEIHSW